MWRICSRALVGMVKPVSVTRVAGRNLNHQKGVPRLPVPPLQQSCELYLHFLEPVLEEDELKRTKELVEEFQRAGGVGERLQRGLERKAQTTENWLTDDYLKHIYLSNRFSAVCHSTVGASLPPMDFKDKKEQLRFAADVISAAVEMKTIIENETMPAEHVKGRPMCMKQYEALFSSCRIPGLEMDSLEYYAKTPNPPKHITVAHNSHFFVLDVYHTDGTPLTVDQLCVQLERICTSSPQTNTEPVGILTSAHRDLWSKSYSNLIKDETNRESLSAIQRSIAILSLDRAAPPVSDEPSEIIHSRQMIYGGGSQSNSGNRWYDQTTQISIGEDGKCTSKFSHVAVDGIVSMVLTDYLTSVQKRQKKQVMQSPMEPLPVPQKLQFNLTPEVKEDIEEAKRHIDRLAQDMEIKSLAFKHFGKDVLKAHKMFPDAFLQLAIQLAFYRTNQRLCSTLEPATLRFFHLGRVGSINSNSPASAAFVKAFDEPKKQNSEKIDLLEKAIKAHRWYSNLVNNGQDIENHFLGLKMQAIEEKIPMPDLFKDISYAKAFEYELLTSQVASKTGCEGVLMPLPGSCHVGYGILNDQIAIKVSAFKESGGSSADAMIRALEHALLDMKTMLDQRDEL